MSISSLGNELLGLEYCIREAFKKIKASDKKFSDIKEEDLVILVEPFQNNCFRKKITVKAIRK
jgi:Zn-finger domain-containing protein